MADGTHSLQDGTRVAITLVALSDLRSMLLVLGLESVTILTPLSMATGTEQCCLCFTYPLVLLVKSLLRSSHLNYWLMAKPSLSCSLHILGKIL